MALKLLKIANIVKKNGLRRSARVGLNILRNQVRTRARRTDSQFLFVSPPIGNTGAPQVLLQIIDDFAQVHGPAQVHLVAPSIEPAQSRRLEAGGIAFDKSAEMGSRLIRMQLALRGSDFVLMNTIAVYPSYRRVIFRVLRTGQLDHVFWFVHEDRAQLPLACPALLEPSYRRQVRELIEADRLTFAVPSSKVKAGYDELLETERVIIVPYRVEIGEMTPRMRPESEYDKLHFLLTGTPGDGRKGQLIVIFAFQELLMMQRSMRANRYRDFTVSFIGIDDDYVSKQIRTTGLAVLGDRLELHPKVSYEASLEIADACNVVMCCSLNEAFPLYIAEAMALGHVLLRNDAGGREEQLKEGVNGYYLDSENIVQIAHVLEEVLNFDKTSNAKLQAMGQASQEIIAGYRNHSYLDYFVPTSDRAVRSGPTDG